jgi:hypothetical protein
MVIPMASQIAWGMCILVTLKHPEIGRNTKAGSRESSMHIPHIHPPCACQTIQVDFIPKEGNVLPGHIIRPPAWVALHSSAYNII